MKKTVALVVLVFAALLVFKPASAAQDLNATSETTVKIGVVDLNRALNEVNEGKKAKADLEKEFKAKKGELDSIKNEIESLRQTLEKKSAILSAEALKDERENYQRKFIEYQQKAKDYTEKLAMEEGETTSKIIGKLRAVVETIAKKEGYTFVFEKSQGGVVYGPTSADITNDLIKQYNK